MHQLKKSWQKVPAIIRKPVVLFTGLIFLVSSLLLGWLPGPGGIPLFLIGIAILSTEYPWARKLRNILLDIILEFSQWYKQNRFAGSILVGTLLGGLLALGTIFYRYIW